MYLPTRGCARLKLLQNAPLCMASFGLKQARVEPLIGFNGQGTFLPLRRMRSQNQMKISTNTAIVRRRQAGFTGYDTIQQKQNCSYLACCTFSRLISCAGESRWDSTHWKITMQAAGAATIPMCLSLNWTRVSPQHRVRDGPPH